MTSPEFTPIKIEIEEVWDARVEISSHLSPYDSRAVNGALRDAGFPASRESSGDTFFLTGNATDNRYDSTRCSTHRVIAFTGSGDAFSHGKEVLRIVHEFAPSATVTSRWKKVTPGHWDVVFRNEPGTEVSDHHVSLERG